MSFNSRIDGLIHQFNPTPSPKTSEPSKVAVAIEQSKTPRDATNRLSAMATSRLLNDPEQFKQVATNLSLLDSLAALNPKQPPTQDKLLQLEHAAASKGGFDRMKQLFGENTAQTLYQFNHEVIDQDEDPSQTSDSERFALNLAIRQLNPSQKQTLEKSLLNDAQGSQDAVADTPQPSVR